MTDKEGPRSLAEAAKETAARSARFAGAAALAMVAFGFWLFRDRDRDSRQFDPDPLWRAGYGFNNPNPDRIREGKPALNFDGSIAE